VDISELNMLVLYTLSISLVVLSLAMFSFVAFNLGMSHEARQTEKVADKKKKCDKCGRVAKVAKVAKSKK